jgi:hypothetical protein
LNPLNKLELKLPQSPLLEAITINIVEDILSDLQNDEANKQDSDQLELDWYDTGFDDQTEEHLGIIINDENDQDEVMLDKYAEAV